MGAGHRRLWTDAATVWTALAAEWGDGTAVLVRLRGRAMPRVSAEGSYAPRRCDWSGAGGRATVQVGWEVSVAEHRLLGELREFLRFLSSLWGIRAGISLLFPLSNVLARVIPVSDAGRPFEDLSSAIVTSVTTVTCLFVTFATFGRRDQPDARPISARDDGVVARTHADGVRWYVSTAGRDMLRCTGCGHDWTILI